MINNLINTVSAQPNTTLSNPLGVNNIADLVGAALNIVIGIGWAIAFVYLAWGFITYITSKGEKDKTSQAQQTITYAIIGGIGLLLLGSVKNILTNILGADSLSEIEDYVPGAGGSNTGGGGGGTNQ